MTNIPSWKDLIKILPWTDDNRPPIVYTGINWGFDGGDTNPAETQHDTGQTMHTPELYEIRIASHLSESVGGRFEGLSVRLDPGGETVLSGTLDQSALHGVLTRIRDLGLKLVSVNRIGPTGGGLPGASSSEV